MPFSFLLFSQPLTCKEVHDPTSPASSLVQPARPILIPSRLRNDARFPRVQGCDFYDPSPPRSCGFGYQLPQSDFKPCYVRSNSSLSTNPLPTSAGTLSTGAHCGAVRPRCHGRAGLPGTCESVTVFVTLRCSLLPYPFSSSWQMAGAFKTLHE